MANSGKVPPKVLRQIETAVQAKSLQNSTRPATGAASAAATIDTLPAAQTAKEGAVTVVETRPKQKSDRVIWTGLSNGLVYRQLGDGQYLLSVYPKWQVGAVLLGVIVVAVAVKLMRRTLSDQEKQLMTLRRQVRRIEL